jgi:hypothetical protein
MQHLDEGTIHAWLDGALPVSEAASIESHIARCAECAALVAEARGLIAGASRIAASLDHVPDGVVPKAPPPPGSLWRTLRLTPARASIAALLLVGVASMFTARRGPVHGVSADSVAVVRTASAPASAPGPMPSTPAASPSVTVRPKTVVPPSPRQPRAAAKHEVAEPAKPTASEGAEGVAASDSTRAQRTASSLQRDLAAASAPAVAPRMLRQVFDASALSPEGCYRLLTDSARPTTIPARFALQRDSTGRNVVLSVSAENRTDSVLGGFVWRQISPSMARLITPTAQLVLTTSGSEHARLETANGSTGVPLQRTPCRP